MAKEDELVSKIDFVWTMVRLAAADRSAYRAMRERGWLEATRTRLLDGESEITN